MDNSTLYEAIHHTDILPFKCFTASLESSCPHWHDDYEFVIVISKSITIRTDGVNRVLREGDLYLFNSQAIHSIFDCDPDNICLFVQFSPALLTDAISFGGQRLVFHLYDSPTAQSTQTKLMQACLKLWLLLHRKEKAYPLFVRSVFYHLLGDLLSEVIYEEYYSHRNTAIEQERSMMVRFTNFVAKHYKEDIDQDDLCKHLGMSRSTLYRFAKHYLGISIMDFIRFQRISKAKELIKDTDFPISQIALEVGYKNEASFYRAFKKETDLTPSDYKHHGHSKSGDDRIQGYISLNQAKAYALIDELYRSL